MNKLENYIIEIPNIVSDELCSSLVNEFAESNEWNFGFMDGKVDTYTRNCKTISLSSVNTIQKNSAIRAKLDKDVFGCISSAIQIYNTKFEECTLQQDDGYALLQYSVGEYIKKHVDTGTNAVRTVSCSLGLNDEYTGGEFYFPNLDKKIKLAKGSILLFPSNFMYPHEILEVTSGTRYSIITWLS